MDRKKKNRHDLIAQGRDKLAEFRKKNKGGSKGKSTSSRSSKPEQEEDAAVADVAASVATKEVVRMESASTQNVADVAAVDSAGCVVDVGTVVALSNESATVPVVSVDFGREEVVVGDSKSSGSVAAVEAEDRHQDVVRVEPVASNDLLDSVVDASRDENEAMPSQELFSSDMSLVQEKQDQEAECSGSKRFDGSSEDNHASLEDSGIVKIGDSGLGVERDGAVVISEHSASGETFTVASHDVEGTEEAGHLAGAIQMGGVSNLAGSQGNHKAVDVSVSGDASDETGGTTSGPIAEKGAELANEVGDVSIRPNESDSVAISLSVECTSREEGTCAAIGDSASGEATDEVEGTSDTISKNGVEIASYRIEGTSEVDGVSVCPEESREASNSVSSEATNRNEGTLYMSLVKATEEIAQRAMGANELAEVSVPGEANLKGEGNLEDSDSYNSAHATLETIGTTDVNPDETNVEVTSHEREERIQADVEQSISVDDVYKHQYSPEGGAIILVSQSQEGPLETKRALFSEGKTVSFQGNMAPVDIYQLAEVIRGLEEEDFRLVVNSRLLPSEKESRDLEDSTIVENKFSDILESLKENLYSSNVSKNFLHLQLGDQIELQREFDERNDHLQEEVCQLRSLLNESQGLNASISEELTQCRSEIRAMAAGKEELEAQLSSAKGEIKETTSRALEMQTQIEKTQEEMRNLLMELADSRATLESLGTENARLNGSLTAVTDDKKKLEEEKENFVGDNERLSTELLEFKENLADSRATLESLKAENAQLNGNLTAVTDEKMKLEEEKENFVGEHERLITQLLEVKENLAISRAAMESLEAENAKLNGNVTVVTDERKKLEEEKENFVIENERLSIQLLEFKENLAVARDKHAQLETALKESMTCLEQLTEENRFLSSSLDVHKAKVKEIDDRHHQFHEGSDVPITVHANATDDECSQQIPDTRAEKVVSGIGRAVSLGQIERMTLKPLEGEHLDDSVGMLAFKAYFDEAQKTMQKLENAIEGMHSHSVSLSKSASKVPGAGVSKLIQAFESKVHHDDSGSEDTISPVEERLTDDRFKLATEQTSSLRAVLKELELRTEKVYEGFKDEQEGRKLTSVALSDVQALYEGSDKEIGSLKAENIKFVALYEGSQKEIGSLKAENIEFVKRLTAYQSRMDRMHDQLCAIQQSSDEMSASFLNQLEVLEKELDEKTSLLEQEWNSSIEAIAETVNKLDVSTGRLLTTTSSTDQSDALDVDHCITAAVDAGCKLIEELHEKLEASSTGHQAILNSYESLNEKFSDLHVRNELAVGLLRMVYSELKNIVVGSCEDVRGSEIDVEGAPVLDLLQPMNYMNLIENLGGLLDERLQLKLVNSDLESNLMSKTQEIEELKERHIDSKVILKLSEDIKTTVKQEFEIGSENEPVSQLECLIAFLIQKYKEANEQLGLSREEFGLKLTALSELEVQMHQLSSLNRQQEDEIRILKENLREMEGNLETLHSELQLKATELEQSEQRTSASREKLSIAVAKGKGLIVQRDHLKQSLSDKSAEVERCSQELQLKDTRLHEVETKLKTYSEAGERIEALESELSYIRNSSTTLRESFLLKDSVIQRIEEILEDLELPEHFHSRDIIDKIEWLARSVTGGSIQTNDWDQKSSVGAGSYSDGGFVVMDGWKDEVQSSSNPGLDDLKRKFEELQNKFYGMAEQNEMLEQSLMERNNIMQRWEVVLDKIDMPLQVRSMEPEEKIGWLGRALYEAHHDRDSLYEKIEDIESYCRSLTAALEDSQMKRSDREVTLQAVTQERKFLSESLENLSHEHEKISEKVVQYELENERLQNEVTTLQEKLVENLESKDYLQHVELEIKRLNALVSDALQDQTAEDVHFGGTDTECLEGSLRKLIESYMALSSEKAACKDALNERHAEDSDVVIVKQVNDDALKSVEQDRVVLKEELQEASSKLIQLKEERDNILEQHQSLASQFDTLVKQRDGLQERLSQEEQKLTSTRDKLNVAVRKGKALVQQRDSLKQTIEELNAEVEHLKNERNQQENAFLQYEQKIKNLSMYPEKVEALEHECLFSRNHLAELESNLQDSEHNLNRLLNALSAIDLGVGLNIPDPINKMEEVGRVYNNLQAALVSSENETRKSKRATDLLLAELNEVHERADGLQEELSRVEALLVELSKEKDVAEAARNESLSRLEKVTAAWAEERKSEHGEAIKLIAGINQLRKGCLSFTNMLTAVFTANMELLRNVETGMESMLNATPGTNVDNLPTFATPADMFEVKFSATGALLEMKNQEHFNERSIIDMLGVFNDNLGECTREIDGLREICYKHSISSGLQAKSMSKLMEAVYREMCSRNKSLESMNRDIAHLELMRKEKDNEIVVLQRDVALMYEACSTSIFELENQKSQLIGNGLASGVHVLGETNRDFRPFTEFESIARLTSFTEETIRTVADKLLSAVKDSANIRSDMVVGSQKELKATILNLQKELQEKDIQRNRVFAELVNQIQKAEASAKSYLLDLESAKSQVENLENRIETVEEERRELELRIRELQDERASSVQMQETIVSLTDSLTARGQEIDDLMQALDEDESQIVTLKNKIEGLEKTLQEKNLAFENLEASRGKAMAKLSTTVSKFDELHKLCQSLLSEVENLQSQLQGRDEEISFLRQEVTRCTNDVLVASQVSNKRKSTEMHDLLTWLDTMVSRLGGHDMHLDDKNSNQVEAYKEILEKQIISLMSQMEELCVSSQSKDASLHLERSKIQELLRKTGALERSLSQKESRIASLESAHDPGEATSVTSEIVEVEPMISKRGVSGPRSVRKLNNDQVAIDMDAGGGMLDEDDDKVHGFKSLTTSRIVPKCTRPVSDMIDGLWVSCDRALMRQPALRLGIILYWFVMHTLLATSLI